MNKNMTGIISVIILLVMAECFVCLGEQAETFAQVKQTEEQCQCAEELGRQLNEQRHLSDIHALEALIYKSHALFLAGNDLDALLVSVKAGKIVKQPNMPTRLRNQTIFNLREVVYGIREKNQLVGGEFVQAFDFSPDSKILASGTYGHTITLWNVEGGRKIKTLKKSPEGYSSDAWKIGYSDIKNIEFSPDGTMLASQGNIHIKLWDINKGREFATLSGNSFLGNDPFIFSPDSTKFALKSLTRSDVIELWDIKNNREIYPTRKFSIIPDPIKDKIIFLPKRTFGKLISISFLPIFYSRVLNPVGMVLVAANSAIISRIRNVLVFSPIFYNIMFSPDGKIFAVNSDKAIRLWNVTDGTGILTLRSHSELAFSPNSQMFASGGKEDNTIKLWNLPDGNELYTLQGHSKGIVRIAFSPNGTILASESQDRTIKLWNVLERKEISTIPAKIEDVNVNGTITPNIASLIFSPNGKVLASETQNGTIKLWDTSEGKEISTIQPNTGDIINIARIRFSPDSTIVAATGNSGIKFWSVADGKEMAIFPEHSYSSNIRFSPDGKTFASNKNDIIRLWDIENWNRILSLKGHSDWIHHITFSPDGKLLASGSRDETIKLWNIFNGAEVNTFTLRDIFPFTFSPDGSILASRSSKDAVKLWNVRDGEVITTLQGYSVTSIAFNSDGTILASGSKDGTIKLWNVTDSGEIATLQEHSDKVNNVAFSPDGRILASGSDDKTIKLWDVTNRKEITTLQGHSRGIYRLAFSPTGTILASVQLYGASIKLWDVATGREIITLQGHSGEVRCINFSPDGTILASGSQDNTIKLWDVCNGREIITLRGHSTNIWKIEFSPDGTILASRDHSDIIKFWNIPDGSEILISPDYVPRKVGESAFSPDGKWFASSSYSDLKDEIILWNLDLDDLLVRGCKWMHGYLKNNPNVSEEDRGICDDILNNT